MAKRPAKVKGPAPSPLPGGPVLVGGVAAVLVAGALGCGPKHAPRPQPPEVPPDDERYASPPPMIPERPDDASTVVPADEAAPPPPPPPMIPQRPPQTPRATRADDARD